MTHTAAMAMAIPCPRSRDEACRTTGAGQMVGSTRTEAGRFAPLHVATGLGYAALDGTVVGTPSTVVTASHVRVASPFVQ